MKSLVKVLNESLNEAFVKYSKNMGKICEITFNQRGSRISVLDKNNISKEFNKLDDKFKKDTYCSISNWSDSDKLIWGRLWCIIKSICEEEGVDIQTEEPENELNGKVFNLQREIGNVINDMKLFNFKDENTFISCTVKTQMPGLMIILNVPFAKSENFDVYFRITEHPNKGKTFLVK